MIKAAIFDFNGTLFDDEAIHREIWRHIYNEITNNLGDFDEFFNSMIGSKNDDLINAIYKHINQPVSEAEIQRLSIDKEAQYREYSIEHDCCHLIKGADKVMDYIKSKGLKINLSSTSIEANINFFFKEFGIGKWIDRNLVSYDDGILTKKVEMYKQAAKRLNVDLADCVIFEDSQYGIDSAYEAGCRNIIVIDPRGIRHICPGVKQIVKDYTEVDLSIFD